ncbi:MAG TPA: NADH-ubiquinone oxidoreductase-F iron-sulfur binding region domain-containing protein [Dermatophilaceae bacterium]
MTAGTRALPSAVRNNVGLTPAVSEGPALLAGIAEGPGLRSHRDRLGPAPTPTAEALVEMARDVDLRGRGGAGFPFAIKLAAAARRKAVVVVNAAEGEPASHKDAALITCSPHVVLDGAAAVAHALGTREVHIVVPSDVPSIRLIVEKALDDRSAAGERLKVQLHDAAPRFVAGQAQAVLQLLAGRENLPVTAWQPEAVKGHRGRPTLLSNAETFAHLGHLARVGSAGYAAHGTADEPGTTLLTLRGDGWDPEVREVAFGTPLEDVLTGAEMAQPLLLGGYHGTWLRPQALPGLTVSRKAIADAGATIGAGVMLPLAVGWCPLVRTVALVDYLAGQSAGRCGPCRNGLPAMAEALRALVLGGGPMRRVEELCGLVVRRGACAHPDGTARLVTSMLKCFPHEVDSHSLGTCRSGLKEEIE